MGFVCQLGVFSDFFFFVCFHSSYLAVWISLVKLIKKDYNYFIINYMCTAHTCRIKGIKKMEKR